MTFQDLPSRDLTRDRPSRNLPSRARFRALLAVVGLTVAALAAGACWRLPSSGAEPSTPPRPLTAPEDGAMGQDGRLAEIQKKIADQQLEAASELAGSLLADARAAGDEETLTRALLLEVQLRTALHGYETAVRFLREEPWPEALLHRTALELYYAESLVTYARSYSWEIRQRERVETGSEVDLKAWTLEQIAAEAEAAYLRLWADRQSWGAEPIGRLAEHLEQNDYPPRIRGTLRDAVSSLFADLLADSSLWRPADTSSTYRLDLGALLAGEGADLGDEELHPLVGIAAILGDLETWHRSGGRPEAAFEAYLERHRRLAEHFTRADDRERLRADLQERLAALGRSYAWWSTGQAALAELVRDSGTPGSLAAAREIALEGLEAHPESFGGRRCRHLVESIEAPSYELVAMSLDGPGKRSLQVLHKNLGELWLRAYRLDVRALVESSRDARILPSGQAVEDLVESDQPAYSWRLELPPTPDYRDHTTYAVPPIEEAGAYLVVASARQDFRVGGNRLTAVHLTLADLVLMVRPGPGGGGRYEVSARSGSTGEAVAGARVHLYRFDWRQGHQRVETRTTGADGIVSLPAGRGRYFLLAESGDEVVLDSSNLGRPGRAAAGEQTAALLYTDRSVYRPQQEILWKAVAYRGEAEEGRLRILETAALTVELRDANNQVVASEEVTTNAFGSASGRFSIPAGRLLGGWHLRTSLGGFAQVRVEEYKRPTFEVTLAEAERPLRLNRPAELGGEARYYFGLPVSEGEVSWRVSREPVYPWWWHGGWGFRGRWGGPHRGSEVVAAGRESLDAEGRFRVVFTPEADEREAATGVTYRFRLDADVTGGGGETRSASRSLRLGFVAVEASLDSGRGFLLEGQPAAVAARRTDLDGAPRPGRAAWKLLRLDQPRETLVPADQPLPAPPEGEEPGYRTPGDALRPRWEPGYRPEEVLRSWTDGEAVARGALRHGVSGEASIELPGLTPGAYRLRYETEDDFGARYETSKELVVAGRQETPLALPAALWAERSSVPVGETARLFVHSGVAGQEMVLELFRSGRRVERRVVTAGSGGLIEIAVEPEHRGGFGVALTALRDHQRMTLEERVFVPWDDRELRVELATFRDRLRPGARESWKVVVKGRDEAALAAGTAELLAYMYDRSLELFAAHHPPDPLSLYPNRTAVPPLSASLGVSHAVWRQEAGFASVASYPHLRTDSLKSLPGYGIGGMGERMRHKGVPLPQAAMADSMMAQQSRGMEARLQALGYVNGGRGEAEELAQSPAAPPPEAEPEGEALRTDFAETAFWEPHLLLGEDGSAAFEFEVPDSVTEWNVWVHALTRDLRSGRAHRQAQTVKDLLVRPYLPRFLREGDRAEIEVVVNNAGEKLLEGRLDFELLDPETDESVAERFGLEAARAEGIPFRVEPGRGTTLSFPVAAPPGVGSVAVRVRARAGDLSDGELRPLPLLPGRLHLAQSRFAALRGTETRSLHFADLEADDDPSRIDEQLVVTLDGQLFYGVLGALPYLVNYPYECTEQTLNRFLSTGIVGSLYGRYPTVERMAKKLSARETRLETWEAADPNRKMALEETPWLRAAKGGEEAADELINVLDPRIAAAQRATALAALEKAQTASGGFPWWPGGPPSPYMTLYLLNGFSRALELGVEVPREMVVRAWGSMHRHYLDELVRGAIAEDCCWEMVTFLGYVLSSYPDDSWTGGVFTADERERMLDFSFRHWREHAPLSKGQLALTLHRAGRTEDARLVFASIMDSAKTTRDEGTFWAPEDRAWLWYNDTIESHAFALRALLELAPEDARRHGLVQWLFLNKKLNHWKSTRATAEVLYALVHYLEREGTLGAREEASVTVGPLKRSFVFEPDVYTGGRNRVVVPGGELEPSTMATVEVASQSQGFLFASATWHFSTEELPKEARGDFFSVTRRFFKRVEKGGEWVLQPLEEGAAVEPGDQVEVHLSLTARHAAEYVHLRDPRGAGFEPGSLTSGYRWDLGIAWYEEVRDSGTNFFFEWLPAGEYTFKHRLRATLVGTFRVGPATAQPMYAPEFVAYSAGAELEIR